MPVLARKPVLLLDRDPWQLPPLLLDPLGALLELALEVLRVQEGRIAEVVDWGRPELFEGFGLPMTFSPSHRFNEDQVNAKEVR